MAKKNSLIKRKNLILKLRKSGIKRIGLGGVVALEKFLEKQLEKIIGALKEEVITHGRKTLIEKDVERGIGNIYKKKEEDWEI